MMRPAIKKIMMGSKRLGAPLERITKKDKSVNQLFFIHIPKTAGTSFRSALKINYNIIADYGPKSPQTSPEIRDCIYDENNHYQLKKKLYKYYDFALCGHVAINKFSDYVLAQNTITFVRDPLSQVISHYNHYVSYYKFSDSIENFASQTSMINLQSRLLNGVPNSLIGYIGLTEKFDESLCIINQRLGTNLKSVHSNINESKALSIASLTEEQKQLILTKNNEDMSLYSEADFLHQQRIKTLEEQSEWVYAHANFNGNNALHGCAFFAESEKAVNLTVYKNGVELLKAVAKGFYGGQPKLNFPRDRYIGFHIPLNKYVQKNDLIDVYVEGTGQKLNFKPIKVN